MTHKDHDDGSVDLCVSLTASDGKNPGLQMAKHGAGDEIKKPQTPIVVSMWFVD